MAPKVLEKNIALLFMYRRKIVINFKSVELKHSPSSFPQSKRWSATVQSQKKKKAARRRIYSCFFTRNGSPLQKQQEKVKSQQLNKFAFSLTSKVQEPSAFHSESSKQVPRSWITSTRLQAEISKLAWPRRSHPARSTRVYNVLAYLYADYFDAGTPAVAVPIFSLKKKNKTSVSLEDCLSFSRGLSSVVCLSWKIQSIEKIVDGSAGYRPARERLCPRAGREHPQFW